MQNPICYRAPMTATRHVIRPRWLSARLRHPPPPRAFADTLVSQSYYVGKAIMYGVFFYSAFNWWYYRSMRKDMDDDENTDAEK